MQPDELDAAIAIDLAADGDDAASLSGEELLGRAVLRMRLYRGWSQRDLERVAHVDQSTISRLETGGRSNVGARRLGAVIQALGIGDIVIVPRPTALDQTTLERMLYGDRWERASREAARRVASRRAADARLADHSGVVSRRRSA